jgi:aspartyl protease/PDZ domain-containing protein
MLGVLLFSLAAAAGPDPQAILAKVKEATGGPAWDRITSTHAKVILETGGFKGSAEAWEDVRTGRAVTAYALGPMSGANGFDGQTVWSQDSSKQVRIEEGGDAREAAANDAYRSVLGYFYPERWQAQLEFSGEKTEGARRFLVVRATPKGGRPYDLWIDAAENRIDHIVEKGSIETRTTYYSDFREVNGVRLPFAERSTNGEEKYDQRMEVTSIELNVPVTDAQFAPPAPPPPDFSIAGGDSTTVPFELLNNHIYVQVKLDGKGPFRMLCDTGGANIVTPELARELGLESQGALQGRGVGEKSEDVGLTHVKTLQLGSATLDEQVFAVYSLAPFARVEGVSSGGIVGYEIFKRFVVTVDYEASRLTLTLPAAFEYKGEGTVVPFKFNEHIPQVEGEIDGIPGKFDIDTGSRASLDLFGPFVEAHGLKDKYAPKWEGVTGWGVGGAARAAVTRARVLKLGDVPVPGPVTELTLQKKGAFTDPYVAGNVGAGVLQRFNIVFDYGRKRMIFEENANYAKPDAFDRAGMWVNQADDGFEVVDVFAGSPAAEAGIKSGDHIVSVDAQPATRLMLPAFRQRLRTGPAGTRVRLKVRSGASAREVTLTLRDLV